MSPDWIARGIAAASALIAVTSLVWAVLSWRLTGPALRIHSLAYRQILILRVFNAGRTAESIEHVVLGGRRGGVGGLDLTHLLDLPLRLEPGETKSWRLEPQEPPLAERWSSISTGWASVWLLTGSMRQHRTEVVPFPETLPPEVGWRLIPRRSKWARYAPLMVGVPIATAASAGPSPFAGWLVGSLGVFAALRGIHALGGSRVFHRRRIERWALAAGWILSVALWTRASNRLAAEELPKADAAGLAVFLFVALVLAIPGAVPQVALVWSEARQRVRILSGRIRDRLSSSLRRA